MDLLNVKDLKIYFRTIKTTIKAVDGISFDIRENEIVGLVGESGSGKTITGYSIIGILPKEAKVENGSIKFEGDEILGLSDKEMLDIRGRKIGIIFQEPFTSLNPVLRIGYQIEETIFTHKKTSKDEAKKEAMLLLEKVKIKEPHRIYYDYPHQLSGGQRQRVMIAMALALNPELLIADEPTTALDVTVQSEILKLLRDLKNETGLSILFITHDFGIINEMVDRIFVMKGGKIVESGSKEEILRAPKHEYTKRLIEAVPRIRISEHQDVRVSEIFIETRNLCKSYPIERGAFRRQVARVQAVKNISIKIEKGKTLGLVGESGCGKSTLGKLLLRLEKPDSGEIFVRGKGCQIIFQDPYSSLDPRMQMGDIVLEGAHFLGIRKKEKGLLLKDLLDKVRLSYGDRFKYPHQFSGGQRQRIAVARALAVNPEFVVLDEPVSSLDALIQRDILELLNELKKRLNLTYLFISHDLRVVEYMADEVSVMFNGEIVETASKEEIYRYPKHSYTKRLLESLPNYSP